MTQAAVTTSSIPAFIRVPRAIAKPVIKSCVQTGRFGLMVVELFRALPEWRQWLPRTIEQCMSVGFGSLFIVLVTAGFAGAVTSLQAGYQFTGSVPLYIMGAVVAESIILELGPVLTGLILGGRIGARYAAELGTMRVTEQIDALEALGRNPISHLLLPRVLAGMIMIPVLVMIADAMGLFMGWIAAKSALHITNADFTYGARYFFRTFDLWYSLIKAEVFGIVITIIPCYVGFTADRGAEGVGRAATSAVVLAGVMLLILDTVLAKILL